MTNDPKKQETVNGHVFDAGDDQFPVDAKDITPKAVVVYTLQRITVTGRYRLYYSDGAGYHVQINKMPKLLLLVQRPCIFRVLAPDDSMEGRETLKDPMTAEVRGMYGINEDGSIRAESTLGSFVSCTQCGAGAWHEFVEPSSGFPMIKVCANPECRAPVTYTPEKAERIMDDEATQTVRKDG